MGDSAQVEMLALALCLPQAWERVIAPPSPERHRGRVRQRPTTPTPDAGVSEGRAAVEGASWGTRSSMASGVSNDSAMEQTTETRVSSGASGGNGGVTAMVEETPAQTSQQKPESANVPSNTAVPSDSTGTPTAPPVAAAPPVEDQPFIRKTQGTWGTVDSSSSDDDEDDDESDEVPEGTDVTAAENVPAEGETEDEGAEADAARCRAVPVPTTPRTSIAAPAAEGPVGEQVASVSVGAQYAGAVPIAAAVASTPPAADVALGSRPNIRVVSLPVDLEDWRERVRRAETTSELAELALELDLALPRDEGWLQPWYKTGSFAEPNIGGGSSLAAAATRVFALDRALRWELIPRPRRGGTGLPGDLPRAWPFFLQCPLSPLCVRPCLHKGKCKHHRSGVSRVDHPMVVPPMRQPTPYGSPYGTPYGSPYGSSYASTHSSANTVATPAAAAAAAAVAAPAPMAAPASASTAAAAAYYARTAGSAPTAQSATPSVAGGWPPTPTAAPGNASGNAVGGAVVPQQHAGQSHHPGVTAAATTAVAATHAPRPIYPQTTVPPVNAPAPASMMTAYSTPTPAPPVPQHQGQLQQLLQPPASAPVPTQPAPQAYVPPVVTAAATTPSAVAAPTAASHIHAAVPPAGVALGSFGGSAAQQQAATTDPAAQPGLNVPRQ